MGVHECDLDEGIVVIDREVTGILVVYVGTY